MIRLSLLALLLGASGTARAWQDSVPAAPVRAAHTESTAPSPAEQRIANARRQIAADPKRTQPYEDLALASIRRVRETSNPAFYADADAALKTGLRLAPGDFELQKTGVALLLGEGQFAAALAKARILNKQVPDDVTVYGYVAEAAIVLGKYSEAEAATQWMLNLRANNTPALLLAAELRVVWGDTAGALPLLNQAFGQTPQIESEELAWIANRIASAALGTGQLDAASSALARAEQLFPGSPVTLANLARLHLAEGRPAEAIALLEHRLTVEQAQGIPSADTLYLLALAKHQAGSPDAPTTFSRFQASAEEAAQAPSSDASDSTTHLILYDAGLPGMPAANPSAALSLAEHASANRQDVNTLDAYAWALYANGRYAEAQTEIGKALAVGIREPRIFEHAGAIASRLNQPLQAAQDFALAVQANATSPYAAEARRFLGASEPMPVVQPAPASTATSQMASLPTLAPAQNLAPSATIPLEEVVDTGGVPAALLVPRPTGTARAIKKMQALVAANPNDAKAYAGLGAGFFQRARETGDVEDFELAEQALTRSLDLVSEDLTAAPALETMAEVCMGEHRFSDALTFAQKALALGSGDLSPFAIVGDAYADMGDYAKAAAAYARLQPVSSGAPPGARDVYAQQTRSAYLKFISGDTQAAVAEMKAAIGEGVQAHLSSENLAWLYYELGDFSYQAGEIQPAANAYLTALTVDPGNYRALAGLGKVRASQQQYKDAIALYQAAIAVVPYPLFVAELHDLYAATGDSADAEKQTKLIEYIGLLGHINQVLHNRDLALFYADHDVHVAESLNLARREFEVRSDIYTWDALAWALYKNGKYVEAEEAMSHALSFSTKDAMLLFHAGMVSAKLGQADAAARQLEEAMALNPRFQVLDAAIAAKELEDLHATHKSAVLAATAGVAGTGKVRDAQ